MTNKINKINKSLSTVRKREKTLTKIRNERGGNITNTIEIKRIIRDYYKDLYDNKLDNIEEMDKFVEIIITKTESWRKKKKRKLNHK